MDMENRHQKDREWERLLRESLSEEKPEKPEYACGCAPALLNFVEKMDVRNLDACVFQKNAIHYQ